jgi:hypothetical protein
MANGGLGRGIFRETGPRSRHFLFSALDQSYYDPPVLAEMTRLLSHPTPTW